MSQQYVDLRSIARQIIYDTGVADPECHTKMIGLTPVSEEVWPMEATASRKRRDEIRPVAGLLDEVATVLTTGLLSIHFNFPHLHGEQDEIDKFIGMVVQRNTAIYNNTIQVTMVTTLTTLANLGLISLNFGPDSGLSINVIDREDL